MAPSQIVLLRGINLGSRNRIAMPALRKAFEDAGFKDVSTYVQSGNVVLSSRASGRALERTCEKLIHDQFGLEIDVVTRTRDELAAVVARDPLGEVVTNPKRYQVAFLSDELSAEVLERLQSARAESESLVVHGREVYSWHPEGAARSKLWNTLAGRGLGVKATARNWTTVTALLQMAG
jgi:uncharacterized protein (DUF1697 family)